jgi:iron-sulfur cluster repair protein YtfE (RIC family)
MTADDPFALARRAGLPEDLRVLLLRHPRPSWDASLGEIGRFWLQRHAMFREAQGLILDDLNGVAERRLDPAGAQLRFARLAGFLLNELEGHHHIEDAHYFPRLARLEARLARGFALLDADHDALHQTLETVAARSEALVRTPLAPEAAGRALGAWAELDRLLDRHLADEEDIVAPVLIEHGEARLI